MGLENLKSAFSNINEEYNTELKTEVGEKVDTSSTNFGAFLPISERFNSFREINPLNLSFGSLMSISDLLGSYREINPLNLSFGSLLPINDRLGSFREINLLNLSVGSLLPVSDMFGRILNMKAVKGDVGRDTSDLTKRYEKPTENVSNLMKIFEKSAEDYGTVDYFSNDKATGFTLNQNNQSPTTLFTGVGSKSSNMTFSGNTNFYSNTDYGNWPGPMNVFNNDKATGFTLNQNNQSPTTLFTGVGGESPNMTFNGDTLYYSNTDYGTWPGPMDNWSNVKADGFTLDQVHKSPSKFVGVGEQWTNDSLYGNLGVTDFINNTNSYYNPILPEISGFSSNFNKGGYTFGIDQKGNSKFLILKNDEYSGIIPTGTHTGYKNPGLVLDNTIQLTSTSPSKWDSDSLKTTYYDSIHTQNSITDKFGGPVDFLYGNIGIPSFSEFNIIEGFTLSGMGNPFTTQFEIASKMYPLFGEVGVYHPDKGSTLRFINQKTIGVDFMGGNNSYFSNLENPIPGFTPNFGISTVLDDDLVGLPMGYFTPASEVGISRFLRNGKGGFQSGLTDIDLDTGTHEIKGSMVKFPGPLRNFELYQGEGSDSLYKNIPPNQQNPADSDSFIPWTPSTSYFDSSHTVNSGQFNENIDINSWNIGRDVTLRGGHILHGVTELGSPPFDKGGQLVFETLYNNDHTVTDIKYLEKASKSHFDISSRLWSVDPNREYTGTTSHGIFKTTVTDVAGQLRSMGIDTGFETALGLGTGTEPYVVSPIGGKMNETLPTPFGNMDQPGWTREFFPLGRLQLDVQRIGKFLGSQAGEIFIGQQELLGTFQQYKGIYDPASTILNIASPREGLGVPMLKFSRDTGAIGAILDALLPTTYTEWLDARAGSSGFDLSSIKTNIFDKNTTYAERELTHKPLAFKPLDMIENTVGAIGKFIGEQYDIQGINAIEKAGITKESGIDSKLNMQNSMDTNSPLGSLGKGDIMTLQPMDTYSPEERSTLAKVVQGVTVAATLIPMAGFAAAGALMGNSLGVRDIELESSKEGMPFYFKDLRDQQTIRFRAYIEGLTDTISPNWEPTSYIGRSEPVYTYTNAERELSFTLKLFAQTKDELNMIYKKINRLTSLCYPEYQTINIGEGTLMDRKERMKPPLTKFRLGELFGSEKNEMLGFIKSLSYSFPDSSPWEIQRGKRVPKYIEVSIGFQVIHSTVPSLDFARVSNSSKQDTFYGITKNMIRTDSNITEDSNTQPSVEYDADLNLTDDVDFVTGEQPTIPFLN